MGFVEIDGLKIHYQAPRDPAEKKGQRVMYVHGTGCNTRVWEKHMDALAESHTPVAIDLPGHGQSEGCGFRGAADYSNFAAKLAESLGWDRFVMAGHSLGGAIVLTSAVYDREMLNGIMLIDTGARLRVHPDILKASLEAAKSGQPAPMDPSWAYAESTPESVMNEIAALTADADLWVTYIDWICDDTFDFSTRIKDIDIPALAIVGAEDQLTPIKYAQFLKENMPRCRMEIIEKAGHWTFAEQPEKFTRLVKEFLDGLPAI